MDVDSDLSTYNMVHVLRRRMGRVEVWVVGGGFEAFLSIEIGSGNIRKVAVI